MREMLDYIPMFVMPPLERGGGGRERGRGGGEREEGNKLTF